VVLRPPQHKIGHFGYVSPSQSFGLVWKKLNLTQQKHEFNNQKKYTTTQNKHKKTKARFSLLLRHLAWKWSGSILKRKRDKKGKSEEKRISGEAYDKNKHTIYITPKSKNRIKSALCPGARMGLSAYKLYSLHSDSLAEEMAVYK